MTDPLNEPMAAWLDARVQDPDLRTWAADLLLDLCGVDTTLGADLDRLRAAERRCFELIEAASGPHLPPSAATRQLPIDPAIATDQRYTTPYYAGPLVDDPAAVYRDRSNHLLELAPDSATSGWVLNAHVDTVPPHVPPADEDGRITGRGAADDKGGVVTAVLAARLASEWSRHAGIAPPPLRVLSSIDEEMGGNGTLGALDALALEGSRVVVIEPTDLQPFPANRGAVWFDIDVDAPGPALPGVFREVAGALTATAHRLRTESAHPLFSAADVSFCLGVLGESGVHPASAAERIELVWSDADAAVEPATLEGVLAKQLADDQAITHTSADPSVVVQDGRMLVTVHAVAGHMGSHDRDTDAIAKAAVVVDAIERQGLGLPDWPTGTVSISGGQGFLPDRTLEQVRTLLTTTVEEALDRARSRYGVDVEGRIDFDKLHNDAFASREDAPGGPALAQAVARVRGTPPPPLTGWKASCDARLFAGRCDDVVTFGPGRLEVAHGPDESIHIDEVVTAAAAIALAVCS